MGDSKRTVATSMRDHLWSDGDPISPKTVKNLPLDSAEAYVSSGVIGLALGKDPLRDTSCVVNGFQKRHPDGHYETHAYVPYPLGVKITFGQSQYSEPYRFVVESRDYDFRCGEFIARGHIEVGPHIIPCEQKVWGCRSLPNVVVQEIRFEGKVRMHGIVVPDQIAGEPIKGVPGAMHWEAPDGDRVGVAHYHESSFGHLMQISAVVPACMHPRPDMQAERLLSIAKALGIEKLRLDNRAAWAEIWRNRVMAPYIDGQAAVDAAFFYLNASIHPSSPNSTGLCGLLPPNRYHNFNNHLFWDLETHALPALLHSQPKAAQALLDARFRGMNQARQNAALNGYRGLQFPWEAGTLGQEELPLAADAMLHEQHVTLCVADAFIRAIPVLGRGFMREKAWPIVQGVAEWLESRVAYDAAGAHIQNVIGIGEGMYRHNNNVWTNGLAKKVLTKASFLQEEMGYGPNPNWTQLGKDLIWPMKDGALVHHPGYVMTEEFCPEQLMVIFPLQARLPAGVEKETLRQYLKQAFVTMGMPMHSPYHWVWAKLAGDEAHARQAFERGVLSFMFQPFNLIDEFGEPYALTKRRVGPYLAHCGAIVHGAHFFQSLIQSSHALEGVSVA